MAASNDYHKSAATVASQLLNQLAGKQPKGTKIYDYRND
jgi:hypothetical protein